MMYPQLRNSASSKGRLRTARFYRNSQAALTLVRSRTGGPVRPLMALPQLAQTGQIDHAALDGGESILKSPVWLKVPTGVFDAKATASAMEWFRMDKLHTELSAFTTSPASQVMSLSCQQAVLLQLQLHQPRRHARVA